MATVGRSRRSLIVLAAHAVGDSFLARRDPRVLIVVPACMIVVSVQILDLRLMAVIAVVAFAVLIMLRLIVITASGFPLAFIVRPGDLAVAVARLGVPARFAYGVGLTFRFLPAMTTSLQETISAQRLRGYEVTPTRNPFRRFRQLQPLIVPTVVSAFIRAEDVADALDLRGFGARRRTWVRILRFGGVDLVVIGLAVLVATAASAVTLSGHMPGLWTPGCTRAVIPG